MTSRHPPIGAFIRPVGSYLYCMRVVAVHASSRECPETVEVERWGMENKNPVRDGHHHHLWLTGLRRAAPGVWKTERSDTWAYHIEPLYYRLIENPKPHSTSNQLEIF